MKSYIAYKNQIRGLNDVSETVKTVEKIAASSVHLLKQEVSSLDAYIARIEKVLVRLSIFCKKKGHPLLQKNYIGKKTLIILTGDKGLVGGLWHDVVNTYLENINQYQSVVIVGAKGKNYLGEENILITKSFADFLNTPQREKVEDIANYIFEEFKGGTFSQVDILYPHFVSLAKQVPHITSFVPFEFTLTAEKNGDEGFPIFESSKQKIFSTLLQKYIGMFFYKIIMETKLSELSARTVSMENATAKTKGLIQKTRLGYVKERRRIATQGQLESFMVHK